MKRWADMNAVETFFFTKQPMAYEAYKNANKPQHLKDADDLAWDAEVAARAARFNDPAYVPPKPEPDDEPAVTSNGERVAKSWEDAAVAKARNTRSGVRVTSGELSGEYRSTKEAFTILGLPIKQHQKFRADLKAAGTKYFSDAGRTYFFEIIKEDE